MITIVLDAMGGDFAPRETLLGAYAAVEAYPVKVLLVGPEADVKAAQRALKLPDHPHIHIVHADELVGMSESPTQSFRKKKNSSIQVGLRLISEKKADAFVSAGNTGAVMTAATFVLGRLPGIDRPAIATVFSGREHSKVVMLDMGASADCRPAHLLQFAEMGRCYAQSVVGIDAPRIGLLSIGEEPEKGNQLIQDTFPLFQEKVANFYGNIEGKEIFLNKCDVVVCDGFVGNSLLKFGEGVVALFMDYFKGIRKTSILGTIGLLFLMGSLKKFKKEYDFEETGGAPLLGVDGVVIIAHGRSSQKSIKHAIRNAYQAVSHGMVDAIADAVKE